MKHTPEPWKAEENAIFKLNKQGHNIFLVQIYKGCQCGDCVPATPDELEANARLIAAAPELLETCKNALTWLIDRENCSIETLYGLEQNLKQAILKAEGEH